MNGKLLMACFDVSCATLKDHSEEIALLDQQIGDGDHIYNLLRGLEALFTMREQIESAPLAMALRLSATKLLSTIGGSSGPLLSSLLMGMGKSIPDGDIHPADVERMFAAGVTAMQLRGKTGKGSKTMMDVLIPVSECFDRLLSEQKSTLQILDELPMEAERGMLSTRDMLATKGMASFLGERSIGHIDPGARSCQLIISAVCEQIRNTISYGENGK